MSKKLTIANMNTIVGESISPVDFTYKSKDGTDITITIDPNISLAQTSNFVDSVAETVFTPNGDYIPEYRDLATFIAVIRELSNMPLPTKDEAVDVAVCHKWMVSIGLLKRMEDENEELGDWFSSVKTLISNKIDFKKKKSWQSTSPTIPTLKESLRN